MSGRPASHLRDADRERGGTGRRPAPPRHRRPWRWRAPGGAGTGEGRSQEAPWRPRGARRAAQRMPRRNEPEGCAHAVSASRPVASRAIRRSLGKVSRSSSSLQRHPGDVDRLVVGVALDRERAADGLEQVVVHELVHPPAVGREPVVDGAERRQHAALDAGLLRDLAHGRLSQGLAVLGVALGQAPLQPTGPVAPGDDGDARPTRRGRRRPARPPSVSSTAGSAARPGARPPRARAEAAMPVTVTERPYARPRASAAGARAPWTGTGRHAPAPALPSPTARAAAVRRAAGCAPVARRCVDRARRAVRRRRARAGTGRRPGPRRLPRPRRRPTSTSPPTPRPSRPIAILQALGATPHWDVGRAFGTIGARRGELTSR